MRTQAEIVAYIHGAADDPLGFKADALLPYLDLKHLKGLATPKEPGKWEPHPNTRKGIVGEMCQYMAFAWEKALDHRGISAGRSVQKMTAWLWLLGDDEMVAFAKADGNYQNYGAPILMAICRKYNFPLPEEKEAARNMAVGKPCFAGCEEGCGR